MAELIACPECKKHLQVPDELLGQRVQCPECTHLFTAAATEQVSIGITGVPASPPPIPTSETLTWEREAEADEGKRRRDDDDDHDDDALPRRRRRSYGNRFSGTAHRGGMILAFGLAGLLGMSFFPVGLVFGIMAWIMGNADMAEMRSGRMDPEGEGMTQAGRIMGMISTILQIVSILACCGFYGCMFSLMGLGGVAGAGNRR